jgi:hypothetical protein
MAKEMVVLTGLWENHRDDGSVYFRGNLGRATVLIFKNKYKKSERSPDWTMFLAPSKDEVQQQEGASVPAHQEPPPLGDGDADIPF